MKWGKKDNAWGWWKHGRKEKKEAQDGRDVGDREKIKKGKWTRKEIKGRGEGRKETENEDGRTETWKEHESTPRNKRTHLGNKGERDTQEIDKEVYEEIWKY